MPELPEVETIKRGLSKFIIKRKLTGVTILCEKSFIGTPPAGTNVSTDASTAPTVTAIRRFGKALVIDLDTGQSLMIHLRMTGQLIFEPYASAGPTDRYAAGHPSDNFIAALPNKQTRVVLQLDRGILYFNDQRKFGFIKVLPTPEVERDAFIKKLAPEPWAIQPADFCAKLQRHRTATIKSVVLDQTIICGLGNIYADESLFMAKIHPERPAGTLTGAEVTALIEAAKTVMERSIASGGSTMKDYVKADGARGDYLDKFAQVFNRTGQPCPVCGAIIQKTKVAGRGTHFCPQCQLVPEKEVYHD